MHDAHADLGHEVTGGTGAVGRCPAGGAEGGRLGGRERPAMRRKRRRTVGGGHLAEVAERRPIVRGVRGVAAQHHPRGRAVPQDRERRAAALPHVGGIGALEADPQLGFGDREGAQQCLANQADRAEGPHQEPAQVEAADVLDSGGTPGCDAAVGAHVAGLQQRVAHRAQTQARDRRFPDHEGAAHGPARPLGQRRALPGLRQGVVEFPHGRAGAHPHRHLGGFQGHDPAGRPHLPGPGRHVAAEVAARAAAAHRHRPVGTDIGGEGGKHVVDHGG